MKFSLVKMYPKLRFWIRTILARYLSSKDPCVSRATIMGFFRNCRLDIYMTGTKNDLTLV